MTLIEFTSSALVERPSRARETFHSRVGKGMICDVFDLCEHYALLARYAPKILGPGKVRSAPSTSSQVELTFLLSSGRHTDDETKAPKCLCTHVWLLYNAAGAFNLTAGISQLDFDHGGPSTVARTLLRWLDLQRYGCVHTVFKHASLLLMPGPTPNPHGALLHLDFLAPKARLGAWALEL
jgi:hypothetical protein